MKLSSPFLHIYLTDTGNLFSCLIRQPADGLGGFLHSHIGLSAEASWLRGAVIPGTDETLIVLALTQLKLVPLVCTGKKDAVISSDHILRIGGH